MGLVDWDFFGVDVMCLRLICRITFMNIDARREGKYLSIHQTSR